MDRTSALEELSSELRQIINNYETSLQIMLAYRIAVDGTTEEANPHLKLYIKYAIMIYKNALADVEYLIKQHTK